MPQARVEIVYTGLVQGVGFRMTAHRFAGGLPVTGTVRNLPDGGVELIAEGERTDLDRFLAQLETYFRGNIAGRVSRWGESQGEFNSFDIVA
ncbi:MAG: acylphosphatase [Planctomycetes bacterium]|nr:acylphosphatase [Planctomycetota bacterium]